MSRSWLENISWYSINKDFSSLISDDDRPSELRLNKSDKYSGSMSDFLLMLQMVILVDTCSGYTLVSVPKTDPFFNLTPRFVKLITVTHGLLCNV